MQKPSCDDDAFVLKYTVLAQSTDSDEQDIKIVISTPRLLQLMRKSPMVQTDATYKVIWQGYPSIVIGTTDKDQVFHPFALAVCNTETAEDFQFIFETLHDFDLEWQPSILLADGSDAITNGFCAVFPAPSVCLMCYFHVRHNCEKHLKRLTKGGLCGRLKYDIAHLQTCRSEEV